MFLSVALCTYNGSKFIEEQLNSILNQTVNVNEIIICDDGSTDETLEILEQYQKEFPNYIKVYVNEKSLGTIKNFEKAIALTKGDLIFLSDQDDIWVKHKVETMSDFFEKNKKCKLLFSNGDLVDEHGVSLHTSLWCKWGFDLELRDSWLNNLNAFQDLVENKNKITGATVCFHQSIKKNVLPIKIPLEYWHDAWLGLHASAVNGLYFIEESLIRYRIHENQQVGVNSNIKKEVIYNSNNDSIEKEAFYKIIKKLYPAKKYLIPKHKKQSLKKILKKIIKTIDK